jgi:hypothetical protein
MLRFTKAEIYSIASLFYASFLYRKLIIFPFIAAKNNARKMLMLEHNNSTNIFNRS